MTLRESAHEVISKPRVEAEIYLKWSEDTDPTQIIDAVLQAASAVLRKVKPAPTLELMALPHLSLEDA